MERVDKWNVVWWVSEWYGTEVQTRDCVVGFVGYSCISGLLSYALGCVGTSRAKTLGFELHSEVMYSFSVWYWE